MERINHPNVLRLHYRVVSLHCVLLVALGCLYFLDLTPPQVLKSYLYLVLDYCGGGDLQQFLKSQEGQRVDEDTARHFMCQLGIPTTSFLFRLYSLCQPQPYDIYMTKESCTET